MRLATPLTWVLWSGCLLTAAAILRSRNVHDGNLRWLSPRLYFGIAFLFISVLVPLHILITGQSSRNIFLDKEVNLMLLASAISGICFLLGWQLGLRGYQNKPRLLLHSAPYSYIARSLALLPVMIWTLTAFFRAVPETEWGTVFIFGRSSFIAAGVLMIIAGLKVESRPIKVICLGASGIIILQYLWLALKQSSRLMFLLLFMSLIGLILYSLKKLKASYIALLGMCFLWFFVLYGNARYLLFFEKRPLSDSIVQGAPKSVQEVRDRLFMSGDLDAFENGTIVMQLIPRRAGFYYGGTFATVLVLPIPRAWWPSKPIASVNYLLSDYYNFHSDNYAVSLQAESYANFGWPGIVLVFTLLGLVAARVYRNAWIRRSNPEKWVHLGLFGAYIILVMRGSFHSMTSYYLMVFFWIMITGEIAKLIGRPHTIMARRSKRAIRDEGLRPSTDVSRAP